MKCETKTIAETFPKEDIAFLKDDKGFYDYLIKDITQRLCDAVMDELEKGEKIVELSDVRVSELLPLNMVEYRKYIRFTDLVRCKDCEFYTEEELWCRRLGLCGAFDPNGYCSHAERSEE